MREKLLGCLGVLSSMERRDMSMLAFSVAYAIPLPHLIPPL